MVLATHRATTQAEDPKLANSVLLILGAPTNRTLLENTTFVHVHTDTLFNIGGGR